MDIGQKATVRSGRESDYFSSIEKDTDYPKCEICPEQTARKYGCCALCKNQFVVPDLMKKPCAGKGGEGRKEKSC